MFDARLFSKRAKENSVNIAWKTLFTQKKSYREMELIHAQKSSFKGFVTEFVSKKALKNKIHGFYKTIAFFA